MTIKKINKEACSSDSECSSNYCTPPILGERHCCNTGQKWVVNKLGQGSCTETKGCADVNNPNDLKKVINAIKNAFSSKRQEILTGKKPELKKYTHGSAVCCPADKVCCKVPLGGTDSYECVSEDKCIKPY